MKKVVLLLLLLLCATFIFAQPSSQINLQAVARTTGGSILNNKTMTLRISLLEGTATGTPVWVEQSAIITNQFGLFNYSIGSGTPVGAFTYANVNWATKKFVKLELDPAGGLNFATLSTEELKSVPFANIAKSALSLNLPIDQTTPDNGVAGGAGLVIRSNSNHGLAGISTKKDHYGVFGWFNGDVTNNTGAGIWGQANKDGNGVVGQNTDKGTTGILGSPVNSGWFGGAPVTIDNRKSGVALQLAGGDHTYMEFYPTQTTTPSIRRGYIGYSTANSKNFAFVNDYAGGENVYACGAGAGHTFINGPLSIWTGAYTNGLAQFNVGGGNSGLEMKSTTAGLPYIDFAKDPNVDFNMRLALEATNSLVLQGGQLRIPDGRASGSLTYAYLTKGTTGANSVGIATDNPPFSVKAEQRIAATEFDAYSDKRIKKDFKLCQNDKDFAILSKLEVTNYRHIDFVSKGDAYKKGFIAQQVEQVFPEAVSKGKDYIPNIYQPSTKATLQNETLRIDMANPHGLVKGDKVRFYVKEKMHELEVSNTEGSSFSIKNWKNGEAQDVFVYGKEVNDFRTVDYDRIFTLNVSATQELIKRNEDLTKRVAELEKQNQGLEDGLKNLEGKVGTILKQLEKQPNTEGVTTTAQINPNSPTPKMMTNEK
jgi:hypothetical protein